MKKLELEIDRFITPDCAGILELNGLIALAIEVGKLRRQLEPGRIMRRLRKAFCMLKQLPEGKSRIGRRSLFRHRRILVLRQEGCSVHCCGSDAESARKRHAGHHENSGMPGILTRTR